MMRGSFALARVPAAAAAAALLMSAAGCRAGEPAPRTVRDECRDVYGGDVRTWASVEGDEIVALGATVPLASIEAAPAEGELRWPPVHVADIPLPPVARRSTGFRYLRVHWEPHGHPPDPFTSPHFGFHFYTLTPEETDAIDCSDTTKPDELPAGHASPDVAVPRLGTPIGVCVPGIGMHAIPARELDPAMPFRASMFVGYYGGEPIFL